jgi:hypothetical protein
MTHPAIHDMDKGDRMAVISHNMGYASGQRNYFLIC